MRISDWSSDVCSYDLAAAEAVVSIAAPEQVVAQEAEQVIVGVVARQHVVMVAAPDPPDVAQEVAMGMAAPRYAVHQIDRPACVGGAVIDVVLLPFAAVQQVGPRIAVEDVLAVAGAEDVVAVTAAEIGR